MTKHRVAILMIASVITFSLIAHAYPAKIGPPLKLDEVKSLFARVWSLRCEFASGNIMLLTKEGVMSRRGLSEWKEEEKGVIRFDAIDRERGTARMISERGARDVVVSGNAFGMVFMVRYLTEANVAVISVYPRYVKGTYDFIAVISEHNSAGGTGDGMLNYQYQGACSVEEERNPIK